MLNRLRYVVALVAGVGLLVSLGWHLLALSGRGGAAPDPVFPLMLGIFAVWVPTVHQLRDLTAGRQPRGAWKYYLLGAPRWMRWAAIGGFGYAIVNLGLAFVAEGAGGEPDAARIMTGHALAFYGVSMAVMFAAARRHDLGMHWRCANGHQVSPTARFCEQCGAAVPQFVLVD